MREALLKDYNNKLHQVSQMAVDCFKMLPPERRTSLLADIKKNLIDTKS